MNSIKRLLTGVMILALGVTLAPQVSQVFSQSSPDNGSGLSISPTRTELRIEQGGSDVVKLNVKNVTAGDIIAKVFVNDFNSDDETGEPKIIIDENAESSSSSIKPFLSNFVDIELAAGEDKSFDIDVNIPEGTPAGGYYGVIRYASIPADSNAPDAGQVSLTASVGSIVLIEVPGDIREQVQVRDVLVYRKNVAGTFFTSKPEEIGVRINNQGNSFSKPFGNVSVTGPRGNQVASYELNNSEPRANILPDSTRVFKNVFEGVSFPGRYTVTSSVSFGNGSEVLIQKKSFWYMPFWAILSLIAVLILLAFAIRFVVKKFQKNKR